MRRVLKWGLVSIGSLLLLAIVAGLIGGLWLRSELRASLPRLDGEAVLTGLSGPVDVERDDLGVPTLRGESRLDVARALGFVHAQDRFFQMDLLRRTSAAKLSALLGPALVSTDRALIVHRFSALAKRNFEESGPAARTLLEAYADGVNQGLAAMEAPPPEYLLLRADPEPWEPHHTTLVVLTMYIDLQRSTPPGARESTVGLMHDLLPAPLFEFLTPLGSEWDAPIDGSALETPPMPPPGLLELRRPDEAASASLTPPDLDIVPGSNNWAVAGAHTASGGALVANDMHLGLGLPNIWYRASMAWPDETDPGRRHQITGVTLPGAPVIISGSNGHVAWGFTNTEGDWSDLVVLEFEADDDVLYRTPDGPRPLEIHEETIDVKGAEAQTVEVTWTVWGPLLGEDHQGRKRALRWVAHDPEAVNMNLRLLETARTLDDALQIAATTGIPAQNFTVADSTGRVGWTVMGPIPARFGFDGRRPESWADGSKGWNGYLPPDEYPRIVDPPEGRIWTANNRVGGGAILAKLGDGALASGARARQIRDALFDLESAEPQDMLDIQLDDRALFLERWRDLLLDLLGPEQVADDEDRQRFRRFVEESWTGRASVDSVGYRLVRGFRLALAQETFGAITTDCKEADSRFSYLWWGRWEGPLWKLVTERPAHLLNPDHANWDEQMLAAVDDVLDSLGEREPAGLERRTWGERNTTTVRNTLSRGVPQLSRWLDIPAEPLPGDSKMPRVQSPRFGASERLVVSPGNEEAGIFHMPGGQSGHPLSPYYRKGHEAWVEGQATPFLPGPVRHRLTLRPE